MVPERSAVPGQDSGDPNEPTKAVVEMWVSRQDLGKLSFGG